MKVSWAVFSLVMIAFAADFVQAEVYSPLDDKSCISDGINWENGGNCTDEFVNNPYCPNVWTVYIGQDISMWNDEVRTVFKFMYNIPPGSIIENATFCAYVYWGQCNQQAPYYMCNLGDTYASHIYVPGTIGIPDYNSSVLGTEKVWFPNQPSSTPIGAGRYWCVDATDWVADDVVNGRASTSVRLHIMQHHAIKDIWANSNRIYSRLHSSNQPYLEVNYSVTVHIPSPTSHSLIITNSEWRNVISAAGVRVPVLVSETGGVTPQIGRFLAEYAPDYIYTIGFSAGMNNSFEISKGDVPGMFFPNATKAVYSDSREKGIFASLIGNYLGMPVVFDKSGNYSILDLESMSVQDIQDFYLQKVKGKFKGAIDYLVLTDLDSSEALLAGYIASMRDGYIVPVGDKSLAGVKNALNLGIEWLGGKGFYQKSLGYKKGNPLYLAILGGNGSVPYIPFLDPGLEIFDNRDGWWLYSDLGYSDSNGDGFFDLAEGRMEGGLGAVSLHMARQFLPKNQSAVLIGEYRHPRIVDLLFFGGGMTQALAAQTSLDQTPVLTQRIVEQRLGNSNMTDLEASAVWSEIFSLMTIKILLPEVLGPIGWVWTIVDYSDTVMYSVLELDWKNANLLNLTFPEHLDVIDEQSIREVDSGILGYFGVGGKGWIIPAKNRLYTELVFAPYARGTVFENLTFSGFLYDDHDISANSSIKEGVLREGGSVLASTGIVHDPFTMRTSTVFFSRLAYGKSLGEALLDSVNANVLDLASLYVKDRLERILFGDPAIVPVLNAPKVTRISYSVMPFHSFKAQSLIESNYMIENDSLDVLNADDYLMERENPITPVFVREFILPENAAVNWVNVSGNYSLKGLEPVFVYNDSYYTNYSQIILGCMDSLNFSGLSELNDTQEGMVLECIENNVRPVVSYPYPNATFWWKSHSMLDNRTLVYVFVPAVLYENGSWGRVLEDASVEVDYEAQVEMNVLAQDVFLGENETVRVELMNLGGEASGTVWVFVEGNGSFELSENVTMPENSSLTKEFSFAPGIGEYEVTAVFESENGSIGPRYGYFSVHEQSTEIAVPEVNESEQDFAVKPGRYSERLFSLGNSGNATLEAEISCEGFTGISCAILPGDLAVLPGEEKSFAVNVSVPGGHPAGIYGGKIVLVGNEIAEPRTIEIPLEVDVPEVAYWSLSPLEWVCSLPDCWRNFSVSNGQDSNVPLQADIGVEGLSMISADGKISVGAGMAGNFSTVAEIPLEGIASGTYYGKIILEGNGNAEPSMQEINVTVMAGGPEFTLEKEFRPEKIMLFWKQFVVPKINYVEIYVNNTGDVPIEKINLSDEVPGGWKGKKPVIVFVKRNRSVAVKDFSYSYANGYANFSFDLAGKPLKKGEGLEVNYMIYAQPEFAPTGDIITKVWGEAKSHENIYSIAGSSATLKVDYFNPPSWLRWLFVLVYRLW